MRDSLISGQPLYLLYSNSYFGVPAAAAPFIAAFATQATGRVRLQVTGNPPTTRAFVFFSAHPGSPSGNAAAARPRRRASRRVRNCGYTQKPPGRLAGTVQSYNLLI